MVLGNHGKPCTPRRTRVHSSSTNSNTSISKMKVVVRCRPPNEKEVQSSQRHIIKFVDDQMLTFDPKQVQEHFFYQGVRQSSRDISKRVNKHLNFVFDHIFNFESTNNDIYEACIKELLDSIMLGYNCSVFAYGATGAGKTHTMLGNETSPGISYLTLVGLFDKMKEFEESRTFDLAITYVEVYNENVHDLLKPSGQLHLREEARGGVMVSGVSVHIIKSAIELLSMLEKGNRNRTQHPTDANAQSSRSHAVFQIHMRMTTESSGEIKRMKLSMIDLAGSERASATAGLGARFKEGANINKSLLALGNCINSLADGHSHIPYRDSKLTRLLKDSLGGNCKTVMIANISPSSVSYEDTYNTLKYATRAKNIKTNMSTNVVHQRKDIAFYVERVKALERENELLKKKLTTVELHAPKQQPRPVQARIMQQAAAQTVTKTCTPVEVRKLRMQIFNELSNKFNEVKRAQDQILLVQSLQKILGFRSKLKEDISSRLKDILTEICDDDESQIRIMASSSQFQKQISGLDMKLTKYWENYMNSYADLQSNIVSKKNNKYEIKLDDFLNSEVMKLNNAALISQIEHSKKILILESKEVKKNSLMLIKTVQLLFYYHKCMKGHKLCTSEMDTEMKHIIRQLEQGFKSVSWEEDDESVDINLADLYTLTLLKEENAEKSEDSPLNTTVTLSEPTEGAISCGNSVEADPSANSDKVSAIQTNLFRQPLLSLANLCITNDRLIGKPIKSIPDSDSENDCQLLSDNDYSETEERTFVAPVNRTKILNNCISQKNILKEPKNKSILNKNSNKIFKSPKLTPLRLKRENKENTLKKNSKAGKSMPGTMGTSSRFPSLGKPLLKTSNSIRTLKATITNNIGGGSKKSPATCTSSSSI